MMYILLMIGYILFTFVSPIVIVFQYNIVLEEGGYDLNVFGIMFAFVVLFVTYKVLTRKINIWEIQSKHITFRVIYGSLKTLISVGTIWLVYEMINNAYDKIHMTLMLTFFSVLIGVGLRMLSLVVKHKKKATI